MRFHAKTPDGVRAKNGDVEDRRVNVTANGREVASGWVAAQRNGTTTVASEQRKKTKERSKDDRASVSALPLPTRFREGKPRRVGEGGHLVSYGSERRAKCSTFLFAPPMRTSGVAD